MSWGGFWQERRSSWEELERLLEAAGRRPERLGPERLLRMGALYRAAAADLAVARRRFPGDPRLERLEELVGRARHLVYDAQPRRRSVWWFLATGYWREIVARPVPLLLAAVFLLLPAALAAWWAVFDPVEAAELVPGSYRAIAELEPGATDLGLTPAEEAAFSSFIFTHNIQVGFLAFALGIAWGLPTVYVLFQNGLLLGALTGLAVGAGKAGPFAELVVPHGLLELSCIVVVAAQGLRLGWSLVEPGTRRRREALVEEGARAVVVVVGTVPWLVVAGLVEGFLTPEGLGPPLAVGLGTALAAAYWALVAWRGSEPGPGLGS